MFKWLKKLVFSPRKVYWIYEVDKEYDNKVTALQLLSYKKQAIELRNALRGIFFEGENNYRLSFHILEAYEDETFDEAYKRVKGGER